MIRFNKKTVVFYSSPVVNRKHGTEDGTHIKGWKRVLPPDVAMETYWMMVCSGLPWIDIIVGLPCAKNLMQARIIRIEKDDRLQQNLFRSAEDWRERHLIKNNCPPVDASRACASFLLDRFAIGNDAIRPATNQEESLLVDYEKSLEEYRMAEAQSPTVKKSNHQADWTLRGLRTTQRTSSLTP